MSESFLKYLQYEKRYSNHTLFSYKNDLGQFRHFLNQNYPETSIEDANHALLRDWVISLSGKGIGESSINRKLVSLRSFFKFLIKKGLATKNPVLKLSNLKTKKRLPHFVLERDMEAALDHKKVENDFKGIRDQLTVEILYGTGIRLNELINLRENDFDPGVNTIKVLGKRNKERIIPVTLTLSAIIKKYIFYKNQEFNGNVSEYLIVSNKGEKSYPMMINRIVKRSLQGTSVDKKSPHILRHTYATHLLERGADLNAVKDLLGHQSLAATQIYTHNSPGKLKKVFDLAHPKA
jgi:integrase/recombinase XerC